MTTRFFRPASVLVVIGAYFSSNLTNAQLVGCDAVGCPPDPQNPLISSCDLGGVDYYSLGIANFTSALSPSPFTWTLGASRSDVPGNASGQLWSRSFYLGAPPTVNMSDLTTTTGCALFFEGVSSNLRFPGANWDTSIGTCSDALNSACVEDLLAQATSTLSELSKSSSNICEALKGSLQNNAPKSCSAVQQGDWGGMTAKNITGSSASLPIPLATCYPTTGANYSVSYVESYNITAEPIYTIVEPFISSITPILTVFLPTTSDSQNTVSQNQSISALNGPEVHLSCMKTVELNSNVQPSPAQGSSSRSIANVLYAVTGTMLAYILARTA